MKNHHPINSYSKNSVDSLSYQNKALEYKHIHTPINPDSISKIYQNPAW